MNPKAETFLLNEMIKGWFVGNFEPTVVDTIAGSEKPTLINAKKNQDLNLTSFTTTVLQGDIWAFNVDSITDIKKVTIAFRFNKQ